MKLIKNYLIIIIKKIKENNKNIEKLECYSENEDEFEDEENSEEKNSAQKEIDNLGDNIEKINLNK